MAAPGVLMTSSGHLAGIGNFRGAIQTPAPALSHSSPRINYRCRLPLSGEHGVQAVNIDEIFTSYTDKVRDVQRFRWLSEGAAKNEYRALLDMESSSKTQGREHRPVSMQAVRFRSARSGKSLLYGFHELTTADRVAALRKHTNRQRQWFLVEVYEFFEEFLKYAYSFMGIREPARWTSKDRDGLPTEATASMDWRWFLTRARAKTDLPQSVLKQFHSEFPRLKEVESKNQLRVNLFVVALLVAQMRHHIVHARGLVADAEAFARKALSKSGFSGETLNLHTEFIKNELSLDSDGAILLLNVPATGTPPILQVTYDMFDSLVDKLLAYAREISIELGYIPPGDVPTSE
ncbi:MAG TPA: hypothetical protein VFE82_00995 [Ramlibacter sp.]|jgi:hypothetical protein|uniref:hypothetical protein n=1 Tax=Ramlibacter sp. TaxID=1917967 RepID=UPI002D473F92|nr:hypothetical protein [Ramlibacter sp.]HZY17022.1 hypothetical protein [Ramlibacter sp.]